MPRLVSRADLARLARVSRVAVTKQCAKALAGACAGDRIDLDHHSVQIFLKAHGVASDAAPTKAAKRPRIAPVAPTPSPDPTRKRRAKPTKVGREPDALPPQPDNAGTTEDLERITEMIQPVIDRFGTVRALRDLLIALKDLEIIREKRLGNEESEGSLIPRDFVKTHIFGAIEGTNRRLLSDMPKTLCRQLYTLAKTGRPLEEAESMTRLLLGKQLEVVKSQVAKSLRNA